MLGSPSLANFCFIGETDYFLIPLVLGVSFFYGVFPSTI
jgi:hypothetical protein